MGEDNSLFKKLHSSFLATYSKDPYFKQCVTINHALSFIYQLILSQLTNKADDFDYKPITIFSISCLRKLASNHRVHLHQIFFPLMFYSEFDTALNMLLYCEYQTNERPFYPKRCYIHAKDNCSCMVGQIYKLYLSKRATDYFLSAEKILNLNHIQNCNLCFILYALCFPRSRTIDDYHTKSSLWLTSNLILKYLIKKTNVKCYCVHTLIELGSRFSTKIKTNAIPFLLTNIDFQINTCCILSFSENFEQFLSASVETDDILIILEIFKILLQKMKKSQEFFSPKESCEFNCAIFNLHGRYAFLKILEETGFKLSEVLFKGENLFCLKPLVLEQSCFDDENEFFYSYDSQPDTHDFLKSINSYLDILFKNNLDVNISTAKLSPVMFFIMNGDTYSAIYCISNGAMLKDSIIQDTSAFRQLLQNGRYMSYAVHSVILEKKSFSDCVNSKISHLQLSLIYNDWLYLYVLLQISRIDQNAKTMRLLRILNEEIEDSPYLTSSSLSQYYPKTREFLEDLMFLINRKLTQPETLKRISLIAFREFLCNVNFRAKLNNLKIPPRFKDMITCKSELQLCIEVAAESQLSLLPIKDGHYQYSNSIW